MNFISIFHSASRKWRS